MNIAHASSQVAQKDFHAGLPDGISERMHGLLGRYPTPGIVVGLLTGEDRYIDARGVLSLKTRQPVTTDSVFQIGSVTKVLTGVLVSYLLQRADLSLDIAVADYVPNMGQATEAYAANFSIVTVRQLLTHTSGLSGDMFDDTGSGSDCLAKYEALLPQFGFFSRPGSVFSYCNTGFILLGRLVEVLTNQVWDDALAEHLLIPLGMHSTGTLPEHSLGEHVADGHLSTPYGLVATSKRLPRSLGPTGMISSTVGDLLRFATSFIDAANGHHNGPGTLGGGLSSTLGVRVPTPWTSGCSAWTHGWRVHETAGGTTVSHQGATIGQFCLLAARPSDRLALAVVANGPGGLSIADELARAIFGPGFELSESDGPTDLLISEDDLIGVYHRRAGVAEISRFDGGLQMCYKSTSTQMLGGDADPVPLTRLDQNKFVCVPPEAGSRWGVTVVETPLGEKLLYLGSRAFRKIT